MRISEIYIYPIKSLRPCLVQSARLLPEGVEHDRRFMLLKVVPSKDPSNTDGGPTPQTSYRPVQVATMNEAALFSQQLVSPTTNASTTAGFANHEHGHRHDEPDTILVRYHTPSTPLAPAHPSQSSPLLVPLHPDAEFLAACPTVPVSLMGSPSFGHRMGEPYDSWFSACLGYEAHLVYVGNFEREILAHLPTSSAAGVAGGATGDEGLLPTWLSSTISSYIPTSLLPSFLSHAGGRAEKKPTLVYNECAPFLVTNGASLRDFSQRFEDEGSTGMDMTKFRPNIVVNSDGVDVDRSGEGDDRGGTNQEALEPWEEDYWAELTIFPADNNNNGNEKEETNSAPTTAETSSHPHQQQLQPRCKIQLTANCGRCTSINIDYATGRPAEGEQGTALKKLMRDRRVDAGEKYTPIFGRYGYLVGVGVDAGGDAAGDGEAAGKAVSTDKSYVSMETRGVQIRVGDCVVVTRRNDARDVWAWPKVQ